MAQASGVPESVLSIRSLRFSSASRSSSRRSRSRAASSSARSTAFSASFASTTARSRDSSSPCSASTSARSGSSGTSHKLAQPELKVQTPASAGASCKALPLQPHLPSPARGVTWDGPPQARVVTGTWAEGSVLSGNVPGTVRAYRVLRGRDAASARDRPCDNRGRGAPLARGLTGDGCTSSARLG